MGLLLQRPPVMLGLASYFVDGGERLRHLRWGLRAAEMPQSLRHQLLWLRSPGLYNDL